MAMPIFGSQNMTRARRRLILLDARVDFGTEGSVHRGVAHSSAAHRGYTPPGDDHLANAVSTVKEAIMPSRNTPGQSTRSTASAGRTATEDKLWAALHAHPAATTG